MTKIEYGDYYRFIVSIGVALISFSLIFPWLVLSEPFDLLVSNSEIDDLTPIASSLIGTRQRLTVYLIRMLPWISLSLFVCGALFVGFGLYHWKQKQESVDAEQELRTEKLRKELAAMSEPEVEQRARRELLSLEADPVAQINRNQVSAYRNTEKKIADAFQKCLSDSTDYDVYLNRRVGAAEFDIVVASRSGQSSDLVVEIKVISKNFHFGWLNEVAGRFRLAAFVYGGLLTQTPRALLLVIAPADLLNQNRFSRYIERLQETGYQEPEFRIRLIDSSALETIDHHIVDEWTGGLFRRTYA